MASNNKLIQEAIAELQLLSLRKPLEGHDLSRARQLMGILREAGYTNQQVSELSNGAWTEPTIKLYTRGVEVRDSSIKQNEVKLIAEMVRRGLSFDEVELALSLQADLDSKGLNFKGVSSLLEGAAKAGMTLSPLIRLFEDLIKILPKSTIDDLATIIIYKDELKSLGIGTVELQNLSNVSQKFGGLTGMLQAISTFESLKSIQDEISKISAKKEQLETKVTSLQTDIQTLQTKKEAIQRPLKLYEELKFDGFDQIALGNLAYTCRKYNRNIKEVLDAVNTYANLAEIEQKAKEAEGTRQREETRLKEIKEKRAHLQGALDMCDALLYRFNYSVTAIQELHEIAKNYGEPIEVLKAVGRFGDLKKIEEENEDLAKKKLELESKIKEMVMQVQSLKGQGEAIKESIAGLLQPLAIEIGKTIDSAFQKLTSVYTEQLGVIKKESEEYAKRLAEAKVLEEELNLARVVSALLRYPTEAKKIPFRYAILFLDAVGKLCLARNVNPKITLREAFNTGNMIISPDVQIDVFRLVDATKIALTTGFVPLGE